MTTQHTPGPWQLGEKTVFKDHGFKVYGYPISAGGQAIARVHAGSVGKEAFSFGNQEANALLIAVAPKLLASLQRMLAAHDADVAAGSLIAAGNGQAAEQARAVIAAATGVA